jgi:hypothetical protein
MCLFSRVSRWTTTVALALAVGCGGDDGGGGGGLSQAEQVALASALSNAETLEGLGPAAAFASFIFTQVDRVGALNAGTQASVNRAINFAITGVRATSYEGAVGMQIIYTVSSGGQTASGSYTGVLGWTGLNVQAQTIDEAVSAGAVSATATPFNSGTIQLDLSSSDPFGLGSYYNRTTNTAYLSTSGSFTLSGTSFAGSTTDCSVTSQGVTVECDYVVGTMNGDFDFVASTRSGSGPSTYTQSPISFSGLPSVRMTISITVS